MADWSATAEAYAASFATLTVGAVGPLLGAVDARLDRRGTLLDVGTGPGTLLGAAAASGWSVVGVDAEQSMVDAARRRFPEFAVDLAALPHLPFDDASFDAVTANFVVNHVPDPALAVAEMSRVAHDVVALSVWGSGPSPLRPMWDEVLDAAAIARPPEKTLPPSRDFARTETGLAGVLSEAGLGEVVVTTAQWDFVIDPATLWIGVEGGVASMGGIFRNADASAQRRLTAAYAETSARLADSRGLLVVPHAALIGSGRPGG